MYFLYFLFGQKPLNLSFCLFCLELNICQKCMNSSVASKFFARTPPMIWRIIRIWICDTISPKIALNFSPRITSTSREYDWETGHENLWSYKSKSYFLVLFSYTDVALLRQGDDTTFRRVLNFFLVCAERCFIKEVCLQISLFYIFQ